MYVPSLGAMLVLIWLHVWIMLTLGRSLEIIWVIVGAVVWDSNRFQRHQSFVCARRTHALFTNADLPTSRRHYLQFAVISALQSSQYCIYTCQYNNLRKNRAQDIQRAHFQKVITGIASIVRTITIHVDTTIF